MNELTNFDVLLIKTKNVSLLWDNSHGFAPENAARKLDKAMLDWQYELTKTLKIWMDKGTDMTIGELILARANLGAIVESWLRFFYCVYYDDYTNNPKKNKNGKILEPEKDLRFEDLKKFSTGILWNNESSDEYILVDNIQHNRNAIHSFTYKDIGTASDFLKDIDQLYKFIDKIIDRLPPIIDYLEYIPDGYVRNVDFQFE